jgi:aryl-alcohol dehydrogenase-like predicted oxidoreductase
MESIDKSLRRLDTDYVDMYFCHRHDADTPVEETVRTMHDLVTQGKILYWGTSEWTGAQIAEALAVCERYGLYKPKVEQPQYSILVRERVEGDVLPVTTPNGIGLVVWSPLAGGMLTGKYDDGVPGDSRFQREGWARERYLNDRTAEQVRRMKPIADGLGITRAQLALAWTLRHPGVSSAITSATKASQVDETAKAGDVHLSADVIQAIETVFAA